MAPVPIKHRQHADRTTGMLTDKAHELVALKATEDAT